MRRNPLPDVEKLAELLEYDSETGELKHRPRRADMFAKPSVRNAWNTRYAGKTAISRIDTEGYARVCVFDQRYMAHRVIWKMARGTDPEFVDHINGNRADNRLCNLRAVEFEDNCRNRKRPENNTSGVIGVSWNRSLLRWAATITHGGKRRARYFKNKCSAEKMRKDWERQLGFHANHGR